MAGPAAFRNGARPSERLKSLSSSEKVRNGYSKKMRASGLYLLGWRWKQILQPAMRSDG
jgi:hypothetical protein